MPRVGEKMRQFRVYVSGETAEILRREAERQETSVSKLMRAAVEEYLKNHGLEDAPKSKGWNTKWAS